MENQNVRFVLWIYNIIIATIILYLLSILNGALPILTVGAIILLYKRGVGKDLDIVLIVSKSFTLWLASMIGLTTIMGGAVRNEFFSMTLTVLYLPFFGPILVFDWVMGGLDQSSNPDGLVVLAASIYLNLILSFGYVIAYEKYKKRFLKALLYGYFIGAIGLIWYLKFNS